MGRGRGAFEKVVATLQGVAGLAVVALFTGLGLSAGGPDRGVVDRWFPFVVAAFALIVTVVVVARGLRRARTARRGEAVGNDPAAAAEPEAAPDVTPEAQDEATGPTLSERGRTDLRRVVDVLDAAGMFAPRAPTPSRLVEAVADRGEPVTAYGVLLSLHEAGYHHPRFRTGNYTARLAFHADQVEQDSATVGAQIADLDRLCGEALAVVPHEIDVAWDDRPTRLRLDIGGETRTLTYRGAAKDLSTVVHVEVARALRERGSPVRLASLAGDAGMWIAAPPPGLNLGRLNETLGAPSYERWEWLDEREPHAAGEA
ncbi:hypothetical protein [Pseudonocardia endophytica]|uniref:Uncharacterized protein n=1 Tax=Pseudonocardia endophytica TaxID=401976 RepID=A0A4V2PHC1_PSEEN|nr:hypothetical protein [Pseudonocardia endophytica]TCK20136.1 hypothetical protein EV378_4085 [Pseudonocardia endophytica]